MMKFCKPVVIMIAIIGWPALKGIGQQRMIVDNGLRFAYTDSEGVTASYIAHFGDTFKTPVMTKTDGSAIGPEELRGKTVVFNFWFAACKPCVAEIPVMNRLAEKYRSDSVVFVGVTWDKKEKIQAFLASREFEFTIAHLSMDSIQQFKKVSLYPLTAIVNKRGRISFVVFARQASEGDEVFYEVLERQVRKALAE
jgi:thiol-disulfide isomerase/thioredoxin